MSAKLDRPAGQKSMSARRFSQYLIGETRCVHCAIANPNLQRLWASSHLVGRGTPGPMHKWGAYACASCGGMVLVKGKDGDAAENAEIIEIIPSPKNAHSDIPEPARTFLQQAYETLHAPDAAAVMAGSAVDAMLKQIGYIDGSVYSRIEKAVDEHKLTKEMGEWAHEVRLGANRPRHADAEKPHVTEKEAAQSVEFAESLGHFLFVLTKQISRGVDAAKEASK